MTNVATLSVDIIAHDKVSAVLTKLDGQLARTNQSATRAGAAIGTGISSGTQKAASGTLALAQAEARLLSTQGNIPGAVARITSALSQNTGTAMQNIRAKTQLAQLENRLSGQSQTLTSLFQQQNSVIAGLGGQLGQLGGQAGALSSSFGALAGSLGGLGAAGAAIGIAKVGLDLAIAGANADLVRQRFDGMAKAANTSGDALLAAMRAASGGEINDLNLQLAANRANLLGVADSADKLGVLMSVAKDRAQILGTSTTQAFNDLIEGLGKAEPEILDNLGITLNLTQVYAAYAETLGTTSNALTVQQKSQALTNEVLRQGKASLDLMGGAAETNAGKIATAQASIDNFKNALGGLLALKVGPYAAEYANLVNALAGTGPALAGVSALANLGTSFNPSVQVFTDLTHVVDNAGAAMARFAGIEVRDNFSPLRDSVAAWLQLLGLTPPAADAAATSTITAAGAFDAYRAAATAGATASAAAMAGITALTGELGLNAEASVLAAAQQGAQAVATANLTEQTNQAVGAFLDLNPSIDAAGIAAQVAAGKIPALIGQLAGLRVAAYSARDAIAALAAQQAINTKVLATPGVGAVGRTSGRNNDIDAVYELQKANAAAAKAQSDQILQTGTEKEQLIELEKQYADAVKASGADSAAAITAETALIKERQAAAKAAEADAKKGGGGGGGAAGKVKLTDQQKLNNTLMAQQTQFDQKAEDAEQAHLDRILSINEDFNEKMKDAQENFAQSRLDGDASFYSALGDVTDHGLQQAMSAQYEAAFLEAEQIAKTKGADVADAFLKAKEAQILAQGKRTAEIAKAEEEGDAGKAEYLRGVDAKYKAAEERRLAAIAAGDDSVAAQRDKALAEEGDKYAAAQDKLAESSERSEARAITAAQNRGAAIDAEGLKVDGLASKYDGLNGAATRAGVTPTGTLPGASTAATTSPAGATAAEGGNPVLAALEALRAAVDNVGAAMVAAERDTTAAVRRIASGSSGGIAG